MNRRMKFLTCVFLALLVTGTSLAAAQSLPTARIGFVHDRPGLGWAAGFRDSLRQEITRILEVDFTVEMPADLALTGDGTPESVREALTQLLNDPRVDLIVASGPLGSLEAGRMGNLKHPVVGSWVLDPEIQDIPFDEGTSGVDNFTYVTTGNLPEADLEALKRVVDFKHLLVVGSEAWLAALPGDGSALERYGDGRVSTLMGGDTVEAILANIPEDADAVYLLPLVHLTTAQVTDLLDGFANRGLPVLAMAGEPEVRRGALVGVSPGSLPQRLYRRVALNAAQVLVGFPARDIPVLMLVDGGLYINVATADRIGVSPPFEVIIEAVMVGDLTMTDDRMMDLQATMEEAQVRNHEVAAAERAVAAGAHQVSVARGPLLPQAGIGVSGEIVDEDLALAIPWVAEQTIAGNAGFSQTIYSDRKWAGYSIEKHLQEARVGQLNRTRLNVGLEAAAAYLDVLAAQTRLDVQRQNLAFSRTNYDRANVRVSVGDANRSELYRWESKIADEQTRVMNAMVNLRLANFQLNRVLDRPLEEYLSLFDNTLMEHFERMLDPRVDAYTRDPQGLETLRDFLVQQGLMNSPEVQQLDALILASEREHTLSNRSFWAPDIELAGGLSHAFSREGEGSDNFVGSDDTTWQVGVYVSLPLFTGGSRLAERKRTTEETFRLKRERMDTERRIEQAVRAAVFQAASSRLSIGLARKSAEAATRNLEIVADNYTLGQVSLVDLLDAQTNALNADLNAIDAVNAYLLDLMKVERAIGRFTFFATDEEREKFIEELQRYSVPRP